MDTNTDTLDDPTNENTAYFNWRKAGWVCALAPEGCANCAAVEDARQRALDAHNASGVGVRS
jgi:hypothetical protein